MVRSGGVWPTAPTASRPSPRSPALGLVGVGLLVVGCVRFGGRGLSSGPVMTDLLLVLGVLAAAAAGLWAWRRWHPASFWYGIAFPLRAVLVYLTWHHVASGCKLTRNRRRFRLTLDAVPVVGPASRSTATVVEHKRRVRRVDVEHAPRLGVLRPTRLGWRMRLRLHDGQVPADYEKAAEGIAHAWRVHSVRVVDVRPGYVTLWATMRDPLTEVTLSPAPAELLTVRPGKLENGRDWVMDFRTVPHWLNAGATQSGKSTSRTPSSVTWLPNRSRWSASTSRAAWSSPRTRRDCRRWPPPGKSRSTCCRIWSARSRTAWSPAARTVPATSGRSPNTCGPSPSSSWWTRSPSCS